MKLSEDLAYWRCERPDEWTMDRFIRKAKDLEDTLITKEAKEHGYETVEEMLEDVASALQQADRDSKSMQEKGYIT